MVAFNVDGTIFALRVFPDRFAGSEASLTLSFESASAAPVIELRSLLIPPFSVR